MMSTESHSHEHVVFLSNPEIGNLVPTVQFAQRLVHHDPRFSATILIITMPQRPIVNTFIQSLPTTVPNIQLLHLPSVDLPSPDHLSELGYISLLIEKQKPHVKHAIANLNSAESASNSGRVTALFIDLFCTSMIDVTSELGVPCYLFFASPATFLGFMLELPSLGLEPQLRSGSDTELRVSSFSNPLPWNVLPSTVLKQGDGYSWYLYHARRYHETKGIAVNTFKELEPFAIDSLSKCGVRKVFPIGPVIDLNGPAQWHPEKAHYESVIKWLDNQPASSVVFLCFGSMRSLSVPQVREIAVGLERAGYRFLWALREPPKDELGIPSDYVNFDEVLPRGFLERIAGMGLVCGWAPQVTILAHPAIGGFMSHCGWNSILESLWNGVPIATWPIFAEQQMNAFEMVEELGLAVKIRLDYREGSNLVLAEEVEKGIKNLMKEDNEVRTKVKGMKEKSRMTLMENGSSWESMRALVEGIESPNSLNPDVSEAIVANFLGLSALDSNKPIIGSSGAIPFLVKTLKNLDNASSSQAKQDALRALYNLSIFPSNISFIMETDLIPFMLSALGDMEVSERVLSILGNVVSSPEGRKAVGVVPDAFSILVDVLNWNDSPGCQEKASYILMVMAHKTYGDRQAMIEAGIVSALLELTLLGSTLAQKRASRILEGLRVDKGKQVSESFCGSLGGAAVSAPICGSSSSSVNPNMEEAEDMMSEEKKAVKQLVQQSLQNNMRKIVKRANLPQDLVPFHLKSLTASSTSKSLPF